MSGSDKRAPTEVGKRMLRTFRAIEEAKKEPWKISFDQAMAQISEMIELMRAAGRWPLSEKAMDEDSEVLEQITRALKRGREAH